MENTNDATAAEKVQYINYSLSKWGGWPGLNYLRNAKTELERPSFNINAGDIMLLPETPRLVRVNSIRNISQLNLALYRTSLPGDTRLNPDDGKDLVQIQKHIVGTVVQNEQLRYVGRAPYEESADSLTLAPLPVGVYLLVVSTDNKDIAPQRCLLHVSDLFTISETLPGKKVRIAVVNATTGKPVSGAKVRLSTSQAWEKNSGVTETLTTGRNGEVVYQYTNRKPVRAYAYTNHDNACAEVSVAPEYYDPNPKDATKVVANTDRTLYRPGQTVHASAILWQADSQYNGTNNAWNTTSLELHDIVPGLKFVSRFSYFYENNYYKNFSPRRPEQGKPREFKTLDVSAYRYSKWLTENTLTYDKTFKDVHTLGLLLSTTADKQKGRSLLVESRGLSDESEGLQYLSYASTTSATAATSPSMPWLSV